MEITKKQIKAIMPYAETNVAKNKNFKGYSLDDIVTILNKYAPVFGIVTSKDWAFFLAQIAHESGEFRYSEEIASGSAYEGRKDLGNVVVGDGVKFKGRGLIQLTGRTNYKDYNDYLVKGGMVVDLLKTPELLAKPVGSCKSAMWFWKKHNLRRFVVINDFKGLTKAINGGYNGLADREMYRTRAERVLL